MKSGFKYIFSVMVVVALMFSLTVPAFARDTYEIEDTYHSWYGMPTESDFVTITADSIIKGEKASSGNLTSLTMQSFPWEVDTYQATGSVTLSVASHIDYFYMFLYYSSSWDDLRADHKEVIDATANNESMEYELSKDGVYAFELMFATIPAKCTFIVEVSDSTSAEGSTIPQTPTLNSFTDVSADAYYYDAVLWALEKEITNGTSNTTFGPTETCTRGQVATFLWRAKGCPEPTTTINPFADVKESDYFYKAVLWAVENGITNGTSTTTFNPSDTCTSAHVITFLWRANGKPAAVTTGAEYYAEAVAWADANELLAGTGTPFAPENLSPRADIVTYLYRNLSA